MRGGVFTKADNCLEIVTPRLAEACWGVTPHFIGEQHGLTNRRIVVAGCEFRGGGQKNADPNSLITAIRNHEDEAMRLPGEIENLVAEGQT